MRDRATGPRGTASDRAVAGRATVSEDRGVRREVLRRRGSARVVLAAIAVAGTALAALALGACSASPATQLIVVVDTDLAVPAELDRIEVVVRGPGGGEETERATLRDRALLPLTVGVAPSGDALGPVTITASGFLGEGLVVSRTHRVTLIAGETRTLIMHLTAACASRDEPCPSGETCGENGCVTSELDASTLPGWAGAPPRLGDDAGAPPPRDAGTDARVPPLDGGGSDAGDAGPSPCAGPADCDDGNACTDDACAADGCTHLPNSAACDDGVFCNGYDACAGGACAAHEGSPCAGSSTCDESADVCTGCAVDSDCPADTASAWDACAYATTCAESGTQTRTLRTFACASGACVPSDHSETRGCSRVTEGTPCGGDSCTAFGSCSGFDDPCDESGTSSRTCTPQVCSGGSCGAGTPFTDTQGCTRSVAGLPCNDGVFCTGPDRCDAAGFCDGPWRSGCIEP